MKAFYRYILSLILIIIMFTTLVFADQEIYNLDGVNTKMYVANIYIEGEAFLGKSGVRPLLIDSRMYIAATDLAYMDSKVSVGWDGATESVLINSSKGSISYHKGGTGYTLNGENKELGGNTKFYIVNKKSMIPVSILPVFANLDVAYDITSNRTNIKKLSASEDDLLLGNSGNNSNSGAKDEDNTDNNSNGNQGTGNVSVEVSDISVVNVSKNNNKESVSIFTGFDNTYQTIHLANPNRFVIDIYGYNAKTFDVGNISESTFISSIATYYHSEENKYRITLNLKSGTTTSNIKATGTTQGINIEYTIPAKTFIYTSDRVNSELKLDLDKATLVGEPAYNSASNTLTLVIPETIVNIPVGEISYSDRNIEKITTVLQGGNYISTISLKTRVTSTFVNNGSNGTVSIKFTKQNATIPTIVIDAGHGGKDGGASNKTVGVMEKELNLNASTKIATMLRAQGYNVIETRNSDTFVELKDRATVANNRDADLFISIHHNSATSNSKGIETLYYPTADNKVFASIVQKNLIAATGAIDRKIVERPNLIVLNSTKMPATLLEFGFISNSEEVALLIDANYQNELFNAVVKSVNEYFGR